MKAATFTFLGRVTAFCPSAARILTLLVLTVAATITAAQTEIFVPGNASGLFGNPVNHVAPFVPAITVNGPGTITVTYVSGTVNFGGSVDAGPNGVPWTCNCNFQLPLQEAQGVSVRKVNKMAALIGVFVSQSRVGRKGFQAIDGTKNATPVGIMPGCLFFIGEGKTFDVNGAGTLFLGINDAGVSDNSGGFNVTVTGP